MRTRAYRRSQRARTVARHVRYLRDHRWTYDPKDIAVRHPADCGGHCELCHASKFNDPRRAREKREWRRSL